MRSKLLFLLLILGLVASPVFAYRSGGSYNEGFPGRIDGSITATGSMKFKSNFFASGHDDGATNMASGASHISSAWLAFGMIIKDEIDAPSDQTRSIANGTVGQMVTIQLTTKTNSNWIIGADGPIVTTGWTTITFDTSGDSITLLWLDDTRGWIIIGNNGCTIG